MKITQAYHFRWIHIFFCVLILAACKKDDAVVQLHEDYFGLIPGRYVTYDVVEIHHDEDAFIQHDTITYQLKTSIGQVYIDNAGRATREFLRYTRLDADYDWDLRDAWTAIIENWRAELIEENQRIIKMVFAPSLNKEWNINAFNTEEELKAYYKDIHTTRTIGNNTYDSTVQVDQEDFFSLIDYRVKSEVYAKKVGLVSKYYKDLTISNFDTLDVRKGKELYHTCKSFGIE